MSGIVAIGERERLRGLALAGVGAIGAEEPGAVRAAWAALPDDVGLVILTAAARAALELSGHEDHMWVVMPG